MVTHEVASKEETHSHGNPALERPRIEEKPFHHHSDRHVEQTYLMQFMQNCEEKSSMLFAASGISLSFLDAVVNGQTKPGCAYQQERYVNVIQEETGHSCALEPPVNGVELEETTLVQGQLVHFVAEEIVGLAADLLPRWNVVENWGGPETNTFVHVLRRYSVDQNR